jgi:hypothetical protein
MLHKDKNRESGVSEVIGFMIILALMVTGIGLVTLYGYPILLKEQASANIRNMEKNFIVIQTDVNSLSFRNVPYKETSLQVSGGTLSVSKDPDLNSYFNINYANNTPMISNFYPGTLVYQSTDGQTDVVLENGAVHVNYWNDREGSAMLSDPRWYYDANTRTLVIPFVRLNASSGMSQTGMGVVKMLAESNEIPPIDTSSGGLKINYQPDPTANYKVAWKNYLSKPELGLIDISTGTVLTFKNVSPVDTLIIKQYNITVLSL